MNIKPIYVIIFIIFSIVTLYYFLNDRDISKQLKENKKEIQVYKQQIDSLLVVNDSILKIKDKEIVKYMYIAKAKENKVDEDVQITNSVYSFNERQLDSTIRQHTHKPYVKQQNRGR